MDNNLKNTVLLLSTMQNRFTKEVCLEIFQQDGIQVWNNWAGAYERCMLKMLSSFGSSFQNKLLEWGFNVFKARNVSDSMDL
jgi:hypothetical protein